MSDTCVISPSKGKKLHSKCVTSFGRDLGTRVFLLGINPNFNNDYKNSLSLDAEGVPLFDSLLQNKVVRNYIGEETMLEFINNSLDNNKYEDSDSGFQQALKKAEEFNTGSNYRKEYIVYPIVQDTEEGTEIVLRANRKSDINNQQFADANYSVNYKAKLMDKARELGVSEKDINDTSIFLDVSMRSIKGLDTLVSNIESLHNTPTAGAAFLLSRMLKSDPIVQRTRHYLLSEESKIEEILEDNGYNFSEGITEEDVDVALGFYLLKDYVDKPPVARRASELAKDKASELDFSSLYDVSQEAHMGESSYLSTPSELHVEGEKEIDESLLDSLKESLDKFNKAIESLRDLELRKINIYDKDFSGYRALQDKNIVQGLNNYIENATSELTDILEGLDNMNELPFQEKCETVKKALDYSRAYDLLFQEITDVLFGNNSILSEITDNNALTELHNVLSKIVELNQKVLKLSLSKASVMFTEFMRPIIGDKVTIDFGENKGKEITIEELIKRADKDISVLSRWLDSAGNSSDTLLQGAHMAIKKQKDKARHATLEIMDRALALGKKAEKAGVKDFSFMYEIDSDGNRTGNYITEYNIGEYVAARDAHRKYLIEKNKNADRKDAEKNIDEGMKAWHRANSKPTVDGYSPNDIYKNKQYSSLSTAQRDFYDEFMNIKEDLDALLPDGVTTSNNAIRIRKDTLDRIMSSKNPFKQIQESVKDTLLERSDDDMFGSSFTKIDLAGNELKTVPIYYVSSKKGEDTNDLTNDLIGALISYAYMANNYNAMSEISAALELGREVMAKRRANTTQGNKVAMEILNKFGKKTVSVVPQTMKEAEALYDDMMNSQVYGIYFKDNGTIGKTPINKNKAASLTLRMGSSIQLGLNALAGIANAVNGLAMQNIEATAREFFNAKELKDADVYYMKHIHKMVGEIGSRIKTNELDLIFKFFNVKQDFDKEHKDINFNRRNFILRMFGPAVLYLYQTLGDNFLYGRSALAILKREKVFKNGKEMSLLEALGFEDVQGDRSLGRTVSLEGITKEDGTAFTKEDASKISRKIEYINQKCFGVYNNEDINAARRTIAGRFLLQYRDWMRPAFMRRFQRRNHNVLLDGDREGYYITGSRFMVQLYKDIKKGQLNIGRAFKDLTEHEQANVRRCVFELSQYGALLALLALIDWPDDKENNWALSMIEYTLRRQQTELGAVIPIPSTMIGEGFTILKDPVANVSVMESTVDLFKLIYPETWHKEMQSGPYKGHSEAYKIVMNSPVGLQTKNIRRMLNPSDAIEYQKKQ